MPGSPGIQQALQLSCLLQVIAPNALSLPGPFTNPNIMIESKNAIVHWEDGAPLPMPMATSTTTEKACHLHSPATSGSGWDAVRMVRASRQTLRSWLVGSMMA